MLITRVLDRLLWQSDINHGENQCLTRSDAWNSNGITWSIDPSMDKDKMIGWVGGGEVGGGEAAGGGVLEEHQRLPARAENLRTVTDKA